MQSLDELAGRSRQHEFGLQIMTETPKAQELFHVRFLSGALTGYLERLG